MGLQENATRFLYRTAVGRAILKVMVRPGVSNAVGALLSTQASRVLIGPFVRANNINVEDFLGAPWASYNEFFYRPIKPELRPIDGDENTLVSPADSALSVCPITPEGRFCIKGTAYTAEGLLRDADLAQRFMGGYALIFRLQVHDYHRYCFPAAGTPQPPVHLDGVLHTVSPIAGDLLPIYKENTREYTLLHTDLFGDLVVMEVGAMMVGRIVNHPVAGLVQQGAEKGYFQFGGSTVVVLVGADRLTIDADLLAAAQDGAEVPVRYGQRIGVAR